MTITVLATSTDLFDLAARLLPATSRIVRGRHRAYFFYSTPGGENYAFHDIDGSPLIASYAFETLVEADAWVREDMRRVA